MEIFLDQIVNNNLYANGVKVLNSSRNLTNIASADEGTKQAITDTLETKSAIRSKPLTYASTSEATFGAKLKADSVVTTSRHCTLINLVSTHILTCYAS